jgi:hypothetical protein
LTTGRPVSTFISRSRWSPRVPAASHFSPGLARSLPPRLGLQTRGWLRHVGLDEAIIDDLTLRHAGEDGARAVCDPDRETLVVDEELEVAVPSRSSRGHERWPSWETDDRITPDVRLTRSFR